MPTAEQPARQEIDRLLAAAGWAVQDFKAADIHAARGVALREFELNPGHGTADYLLYVDGKAVWALNGVRVPPWLAELRAEEIDPARFGEIENAEVRREFVRKVGIERILHNLKAKTIDKRGDYELVLLELGDGLQRPYLKMLNPSIGVWHAEGVHPDCTTIAEALAWRNGTEEVPIALV